MKNKIAMGQSRKIDRSIYFIAKDARWQKYREEVFAKLGEKYEYKITVLTTGIIKNYIVETDFVKYKSFLNIFPESFKISFFPGALLYIVKNNPDYVFSLPNASQFTEFIALPLCKLLKIPIVYWTHGYDHFEEPKGKRRLMNYIRKKYIIYFTKHADHVITFSESGKTYLIDKYIPRQRITVAPNTLDTERIIAVKNSILRKYNKFNLKKELGFSSGSRILLYSGRLNKLKRVDLALRIQKLSYKKNKNLHFIIIGDGEEKEYLVSIVRNENIKNVHFLGSVFEEKKLSQYFLISDIFLMPGYVGLAIIHAFCFGLPIITGNVHHSPEIQFLKYGENGFILDLNENLFVEKIFELLDNPDRLKSFSDNAFKIVSNEGSIDNMLGAMDKAFQSLKKNA